MFFSDAFFVSVALAVIIIFLAFKIYTISRGKVKGLQYISNIFRNEINVFTKFMKELNDQNWKVLNIDYWKNSTLRLIDDHPNEIGHKQIEEEIFFI